MSGEYVLIHIDKNITYSKSEAQNELSQFPKKTALSPEKLLGTCIIENILLEVYRT